MQLHPELTFLLEAAGANTKHLSLSITQPYPTFDNNEFPIFWRRLNLLANKNRLSGLLYSYLIETEDLNLVPAKMISNLKLTRDINARRELLYSALVLRLLRLCTKNSSILVSGSFLMARCIFPIRGQIAFDQLELFVEHYELAKVSDALKEMGFRKESEFYASGPLKVKLMDFSHPLLPGAEAFTFDDIKPFLCEYDTGGITFTGPTPELLLSYLASRFKNRSWCNLVSLISAKACVLHNQFSWEKLEHIAKKQNTHENLQSLLLLLQNLFNINIPVSFTTTSSTLISQEMLNNNATQLLSNLSSKQRIETSEWSNPLNPGPSNLGEYVGTPQIVVDRMLEIANINQNDIVCDLGCGDGRFLICAAQKYNCNGLGIDYDKRKIEEANQEALQKKISSQLQFKHGDVLDANVSKVTVLISYLNNNGNAKLLPKLTNELQPNARVLTHQFTFPGLIPEDIVTIEVSFGQYTDIYVWNLRP